MDILCVLSQSTQSNPKYQKKNRYESVAVHLGQTNDEIASLFDKLPIESHLIEFNDEEIIEEERVNKFERFNDETERVYNRKMAQERLIVRKCAELNIQHVIMASMVDQVASDALTNLCLGLGRHLSQSAVLSKELDGVTILVSIN